MSRPFLLTLEYPPQLGGVAKYLEGEVNASPVPVVVIKAQDLMWRFWPRWLPLLWRVNALSFTKERVGVRLWISHVLPMGYIALVWKCIYKTPYRVYLHGLDLVRPKSSPWKRFWVKMILKNANEIVVNSKATEKLLDNYCRDAIRRVSVQYPRIEKIDIEKYKPAGEKLRQEYNIGNKPVLLTISRLVKRKGIDLVIKSLPDVWKQIPDLIYVVVGEGDYRDSLVEARHCLASTEQQNQIIFTGPVSDDEKYGWLSACNCFILTPIDDPNDFEGYGIVYKEAQMFGKPVIGSRVGGVPEAIGNQGVLVEAGNINQITDAIIKNVQS